MPRDRIPTSSLAEVLQLSSCTLPRGKHIKLSKIQRLYVLAVWYRPSKESNLPTKRESGGALLVPGLWWGDLPSETWSSCKAQEFPSDTLISCLMRHHWFELAPQCVSQPWSMWRRRSAVTKALLPLSQDAQCAQALTALANLVSPISCLVVIGDFNTGARKDNNILVAKCCNQFASFDSFGRMHNMHNMHDNAIAGNNFIESAPFCADGIEVRVVTWPGLRRCCAVSIVFFMFYIVSSLIPKLQVIHSATVLGIFFS